MTHQYDYAHHAGYPINSDDCSNEPAFKRHLPAPQPIDVYNFSLMGIPKIFPLTGEVIPLSFAEDALLSAISEIEMSTGISLSPVDHWHSADFIEGMMTKNFTGVKLHKWPVSKINKVSFKYPNTNTNSLYADYVFPSAWIFLRKNNINITPTYGVVSTNNGGVFTPGSGVYGFAYGLFSAYTPGIIEVVYTAGFEDGKWPPNAVDLVKTWAAHRMLTDLLPVLYPNNSVSVSVDGVSQSASVNINQMLTARLENMETKKRALMNSLKSQYKSVISTGYIGS